MHSIMGKLKEYRVVLILVFLTILSVIFMQNFHFKSYARYNSDSLHYEKATVVEILSEDLKYDEYTDQYLGTQELVVKMKDGPEKGELINVTNYLTQIHHVVAKENTNLIINADRPEGIAPYYTIYSYDRSSALLLCSLILIATIIFIGKGKGFKSIFGLIYSMYVIIAFLLPAVFSGWSPILCSIITAVLSTIVTLYLLNGESKKTLAAVVSTVAGVFCALLFFLLMSCMLHLNGFSVAEAEGLILIQQSTGLQIKDVLFAGVLISSLGAIMDVSMSITSSLHEVYNHNPALSAKELFLSGIEIGKDMIGTMTNTLILAFTGSAFVTLLIFISYQVQVNQLLNSNYISIEIAQGLCGTFGIILTIPFASLITAFLLVRKK